ncbi:MAG: putative metal-dependent hydrolase [Phycisphaerales bacterium]|nr:putative metal-dependent hydrolase [Phycisphaerales bacterium]
MQVEQHIYPIGKMSIPDIFSMEELQDALQDIAVLPRILDNCIENLDAHQLAMSYRENGWTIHQIIHHIADSHMNAFIRTKLALAENNPTIKPYNQDAWVIMEDVMGIPINYYSTLIHALHYRWFRLFESLNEEQLMRTFYHPEYNTTTAIWQQIHSYAWHGKHHAEQIIQLRIRKGW